MKKKRKLKKKLRSALEKCKGLERNNVLRFSDIQTLKESNKRKDIIIAKLTDMLKDHLNGLHLKAGSGTVSSGLESLNPVGAT